MSEPIHPDTTHGPVHLIVGDLGRVADFYEANLGLTVRERSGGIARLGADANDVIVLRERRGALRPRGTTGLFHLALLVPSRPALARALERLLETETPMSGSADHGVSEALYLDDPEGNGIEIYRDRPRAQWPRRDGRIVMVSDPLDWSDLQSELDSPEASTPGAPEQMRAVMGHVHLRASHLGEAERFYSEVLGLEVMAHLGGSASFLGAGGYHHHIALNTWAGTGVPAPPPESAGLDHFVLRLPNADERDRVLARVRRAGVETERVEDGIAFRDPSFNRIVLATPEPK